MRVSRTKYGSYAKMKRRYQDTRFPGWEIVNSGSILFEVRANGQSQGGFSARENTGSSVVSEEFAQRRAQRYFDRLAETQHIPQPVLPTQEDAEAPRVTPQVVENLMLAARKTADVKKKRELERQVLQLMAREESLAEQTVNHLLYDC